MSSSLFIANKLTLKSAKNDGSSGIIIAVTGITLSIIVMVISISVMKGFRDEIRQKVMGFDSQITIMPHVNTSDANGERHLISLSDIKSAIDILPESSVASLTVRQPVIMKTPDNFTGVVIKGMNGKLSNEFIQKNITEGVLPDYTSDSTSYDIVLSRIQANALSVGLNDKIDTYFIGTNAYKIRKLRVAGIYDTHFREYDKNIVFGSLAMLQQVANVPDTCASIIEINGLLDDDMIDNAEKIIKEKLFDDILTGKTQRSYIVSNIHDTAALFFNWLALLDTNVIVILAIMSILAMFTLITSLFMLILRRVNLIGTLKALGAPDSTIRKIFITLSLRILLRGLIIGNIAGIGLLYIQKYTGIIPLNPEAYYLDHVPVEISWLSVLLLDLSVVVLSFIVLVLPSSIISTFSPSKVIRYE